MKKRQNNSAHYYDFDKDSKFWCKCAATLGMMSLILLNDLFGNCAIGTSDLVGTGTRVPIISLEY